MKSEHRTVKLRVVPLTGQTISIVLTMTDGTSARLMVSLGEWSKAIGRPATDVEADCEMIEPTAPAAA